MGEIGVILFILGGLCLPIGIVVWIIRAIMKKNTAKNMKFTCISMATIIVGFALVVMSPTEESSESVTNEEVVSNEKEQIEMFDVENKEDQLEDSFEKEGEMSATGRFQGEMESVEEEQEVANVKDDTSEYEFSEITEYTDKIEENIVSIS